MTTHLLKTLVFRKVQTNMIIMHVLQLMYLEMGAMQIKTASNS